MERFLCVVFTLTLAVNVVVCCPNGFIRHDESCYKIFPEKATWPEAESYCRDFGLSLARVKSQREHDFLRQYVISIKALYPDHPDFWLDGSNLLSGDWIWATSGEPITQFFWGHGEPSNNSPGEHCLSMRGDYSWNDEHCSLKAAFICEVNAGIDPGQLFG